MPSHIVSIHYERSGIGVSEPDSSIVTDSKVVARLYDLLRTLPYSPLISDASYPSDQVVLWSVTNQKGDDF